MTRGGNGVAHVESGTSPRTELMLRPEPLEAEALACWSNPVLVVDRAELPAVLDRRLVLLEDPQSASNGGDLGFLPVSAFEGSSPEIRKLLASLQPGQVSPILPSQGAYRIIKLISREPAGQRDLNDPRVQQEIRQTLLNRKDQLLRSVYAEVARNEAKVVNYFAQKVLESRK